MSLPDALWEVAFFLAAFRAFFLGTWNSARMPRLKFSIAFSPSMYFAFMFSVYSQKKRSAMPDESHSNGPPGDPKDQASPQPPIPPPAPQKHEMREQGKGNANPEQNSATELAREFRWVEGASIISSVVLAVVGIIALCIYYGQLKVMRGQLGEIIKQYPEIQKSAAAAKSAADTADATLKNQQRSFEIDQRPYVVTEVPQFSGNGLTPDKDIQANITFKNIGRTPARKYGTNVLLLRFEPGRNNKAGRAKLIRFMTSSFDQLEKKNAALRNEIEVNAAEQDLAPNATIFSTNTNSTVVSTQDFPKITSGDITLFYIGIASYTDAFGGQYKTTFCYFYFGSAPQTWHICDSHNTIQ